MSQSTVSRNCLLLLAIVSPLWEGGSATSAHAADSPITGASHATISLWLTEAGVSARGLFDLDAAVREVEFRLDPRFEAKSAAVRTKSGQEIAARLEESGAEGSGRWKVVLKEASAEGDRLQVTWVSRAGSGSPKAMGSAWDAPRVWWGDRAWYPLVRDVPTLFSLEVHTPATWPVDRRVLSAGPMHPSMEGSEKVRRRLFRPGVPLESLPLAVGTWQQVGVDFQGARLEVLFSDRVERRTASLVLRRVRKLVEENVRSIGPLPWKSLRIIEASHADRGSGPSVIALDRDEMLRAVGDDGAFERLVMQQWWKHAVYRDPKGGDWLPGLLTYLSDHRRAGAEPGGYRVFRRGLLRDYALLVDPGEEVALAELPPLDAFGAARTPAQRAILRSKGAMVFHMLRERIGEQDFAVVMRTIYSKFRHRRISWGAFSSIASMQVRRDLSWFFEQWTERAGAPALEVKRAIVRGDEDDLRMQATIACGGPWRLNLPVMILSGEQISNTRASCVRGTARVGMRVASVPDRIQVDPAMHVMRRLSPVEVPTALAGLILDPKVDLIVIASSRGGRFEQAARSLTATLGLGARRVLRDLEVDATLFSAARRVWIFGRPVPEIGKLFRDRWPSDVIVEEESLAMAGREVRSSAAALAVVMPHGGSEMQGTLGVLDALSPGALVELGRYLSEHGAEWARESDILWSGGNVLFSRDRGRVEDPLDVKVERK